MGLAAAAYDSLAGPLLGLDAERSRLLAPARGSTLEVGAGTGLTLRHYPAAVTSVVACEPRPDHRLRLRARADRAPVPVSVLACSTPGLPFEEASFDTVVCSLVLCTVEDVPGTLSELRRVLRPDGSLLFLEHIVGRNHAVAAAQRALSPGWARVAGGCRLDRDTIAALRSGGFVVADCERLAPLGRLSAGTLVRGRAIRRREP